MAEVPAHFVLSTRQAVPTQHWELREARQVLATALRLQHACPEPTREALRRLAEDPPFDPMAPRDPIIN